MYAMRLIPAVQARVAPVTSAYLAQASASATDVLIFTGTRQVVESPIEHPAGARTGRTPASILYGHGQVAVFRAGA
jgi:hypothetical protein